MRWLLKPLVWLGALAPALWLGWAALAGQLSANPLADLTNETGVWALRLLVVTLAITPLRTVVGWAPLIRVRRLVGLFAFFYASLHFLVYVVVDRFAGLDFPEGIVSWHTVRALGHSVVIDVRDRPFITMGAATLLVLVPLAVTSTAGWIRRLGGARWRALHRLTYAAAVGGVVHYWWLVKADLSRPMAYAAAVAVLLTLRAWWAWRRATAR